MRGSRDLRGGGDPAGTATSAARNAVPCVRPSAAGSWSHGARAAIHNPAATQKSGGVRSRGPGAAGGESAAQTGTTEFLESQISAIRHRTRPIAALPEHLLATERCPKSADGFERNG